MPPQRKHIFAISGSTRLNSANESILKWISKEYQETLDVHIYSGIAALPHFNPDVGEESIDPGVKDLRDRILAADGVIICTPEYVFSLPGALKNAIEWTVSTSVFSDKPTALIVASGLGEKTFESLALIMKTVGARVQEGASVLISGARSKLNAKNELSDPTAIAAIRKVVDTLTIDMNENGTRRLDMS